MNNNAATGVSASPKFQGPASDSSPRVSVIIPTYNHARFVAEAIHSALAQDYPNFEVIVIDDGSTDNTPEIVTRFGAKIRYLRQENQGLPGARNSGIRAATGNFIALLDSDDSWLPGFLSATVARLKADPGLGAVYTGFYFVGAQGERLPQLGVETVPDDQLYDRLLDGEFFVPSAVVTRRACFEHVGLFDEALRASEDWDMWLRVAHSYRFAGIPKPLANYRIHTSNMSKNPEHMLHYQLLVVNKQFGPPTGPPANWPIERQRAYAAVYRYAATGFLQQGNRQLGQDYLRLALEANPRLSASLDLFYELGCVDQPLGWRGNLGHLNLEANAALLLSALDSIFSQAELPARLQGQRRTVFGSAYMALGLLAYGSDRPRQARSYLGQALITNPRLGHRGQLWAVLARSLVGRRVIRMIKSRAVSPRPGSVSNKEARV